MAGVTATISIESFRAAWCAHTPIVQLCERFTITKDQVIRLRDHWELPLRNDRRLRAKPPRQRDPSPAEIEQACRNIQATWDDRTRELRAVNKVQAVTLKVVPLVDVDEPPADELR